MEDRDWVRYQGQNYAMIHPKTFHILILVRHIGWYIAYPLPTVINMPISLGLMIQPPNR